jgi:hypothetical protein
VLTREDRRLGREMKKLAIEEARLRIRAAAAKLEPDAAAKIAAMAQGESIDTLIAGVLDRRISRAIVFEGPPPDKAATPSPKA